MEGFEEDAARLADPNGSCQGVMAHGEARAWDVSDVKNNGEVLGCLGDHHPKYGFNSVGTTTIQSWNS